MFPIYSLDLRKMILLFVRRMSTPFASTQTLFSMINTLQQNLLITLNSSIIAQNIFLRQINSFCKKINTL